MVHETTDLKIIRAARIAVVDIGAKGCAPCKPHRKAFETVAEKNPGIDWFYVDADEADLDDVKSVPLTRIYVNGENVGQRVGAMSASEIREFVRSKVIK